MKQLSKTEMREVNGGSLITISLAKIIYGVLGTTFFAGFLDGVFRPFRCR